MKKIVINTCYGGFGLSNLALKQYAALTGRMCYFFRSEGSGYYNYIPVGDDYTGSFRESFDIPNPNEVLDPHRGDREKYNLIYTQHAIYDRHIERDDPNLIKVVETLGDAANGEHAELKVVEIPDNVKFEITEYDGIESVEEIHRRWD